MEDQEDGVTIMSHDNSFTGQSEQLQENIKIYLRVRPFMDREDGEGVTGGTSRRPSSVQLAGDGIPVVSFVSRGMVTETFEYDFVGGPETDQAEVFESVAKSITENCLQGYNGTIFAYGQTGSGKTYTMQGPALLWQCSTDEERSQLGLIPRTFEYLFSHIAQETASKGTVFTCKCSYIEIYNEAIYDLLDTNGRLCNLREDTRKGGGVYVEDCTMATIRSPVEAYEILSIGAQNRHVASTAMNRESSRSHSVFTLFIQSKRLGDGDLLDVRESRFNLVDLAGSERQQLTGTVGLRLKEAGNINKSLLALSNVINALVETAGGRPRHVHYRDSKLTFLLRDSLGGNAKTCIIANVSPSPFSQAETLSTLRFAQRAKMIRNQARVNADIQGDVYQLQAEIRRLQNELQLLKNNSNVQKESMDSVSPLEKRLSCIAVNDERRSLKIAMERQTELASELLKLREQLEVTEELCRRKDYQIQAEKMVRRLRESTIQSLSKGELMFSDESLREEVAILNGMIEHHPDVVRFAIDNTKLRERLGQIDQLTIEDFDALQSQIQRQQTHIDTLTKQILELSSLSTSEDKENEQAAGMEGKRRRLSVDTKLLEVQAIVEQQTVEISTLRERLNDLEIEKKRLENDLNFSEKALERQVAESESKFAQMVKEYQDKEAVLAARITELADELRKEKQNSGDLFDSLQKLQMSFDELKQEKEQMEMTLKSSQKSQLEVLAAQSQQQLEQVSKLSQAKLDSLMAKHQSEIEEQKKMAAIETGRLKDMLGKLERSLEETQLNIGTLASELEASRSKCRELTRSMDEMRLADAQRHQTDANSSQTHEEELSILRMELAHLRKRLATNNEQKEVQDGSVDETRYKLVMAENAQHLQKIAKLENMLRHATEERAPTMPSPSRDRLKQLQAAYNSLLAEKEGLQEDNAKLIQHHNSKQKLHYHVKIKEENNRLKQEIQTLQADLARALEVNKIQDRTVDLT